MLGLCQNMDFVPQQVRNASVKYHVNAPSLGVFIFKSNHNLFVHNCMHRLATFPPELLSEIFSHLQQLPLTFYFVTSYVRIRINHRYAERNKSIRALSQTCRALKDVLQPWVWQRLDCCFMPETARSTWHNYAMENLQRKAEGMKSMPVEIQRNVRIITIILSTHRVAETFPALRGLLEALPQLQTIHVLKCDSPVLFSKALNGLLIPTVKTLVTPTETAKGLTLACPNTTHIRCAGGVGGSVVQGLKSVKKCQILDGTIDWVTDLKLVDRLVENAPSTLHTLEICKRENRRLGIHNVAPAQWVQVIPKLSRMKGLRKLILTFPKSEEEPSDVASVNAAKELMKGLASSSRAATMLIVRCTITPHSSHQLSEEDYAFSEDVFVFNLYVNC
ncbi:hypothetical protein IW261DRAFT_1612060 [Armillaria novae-zelandiae]|uniref:F-box domain-containing protein n=1 Tax=Armillaria novae-zelandiae TaxID=153914 RepID=A0AA39NTD4_9AGAR|nr:hypothetical protein IW261DRAFT_1612060 [Armillaria novae-zelandiae]